MVKDSGAFNGCREAGIDNAVDIGIECLENGDGAFICGAWFVMEDAARDLEEGRECAGGEDKGDEFVEGGNPVWVHAGEDIKVKVLVSGFGGNVAYVFNEVGEFCGEGGCMGGVWCWVEEEGPFGERGVGGGAVFSFELCGM